jgi:hypothetical protein
MTILTFPSIRAPSSVSGPALRANTQSGGISPFDGTEQTLELPGAKWQAELRFDRLRESEWRQMQAFLSALRGKAGRFYWGPNGYQPRRGTDPANWSGDLPRIRTSGQTGTSLDTTGWRGQAMPARIGDWIHWIDSSGRPSFHMVTADVGAMDRTSTNLQIYSSDLFNAAFTTVNLTNAGSNFIAGSTAYWTGGCYTRLVSRTSAGAAYLETSGTIAVTAGSQITASIIARLASGSTTSGNLLQVDEYNGGTYTQTTLGPALTTVTGTMTKYQLTMTLRGDTTAIRVFYLTGLNGGTFELQWPQVEYGGWATATILTGATTVTRTQSVILPISPPIRRATVADTALEYTYPAAIWRLSQDVVLPEFQPGAGPVASFTLPIEEAIW